MMMRTSGIVLRLGLLLIVGCGSSSPSGDGGLDGDGGDGGSGCRRDSECAPPTPRCQVSSGTCLACLTSLDCTRSETCVGGVCKPGQWFCESDEDCTPQLCDTRTGGCVECLSDRHCPTDFVCQDGQCKPKQGLPCETDADCNLGELCIDKACVVGCRSSRDCPQGLLCDSARGDHGQCVQCLSAEDCPLGLRCADGQCQFFCSSDADCPGRYCDPQSERCVDCLETDHCALGNICYQNSCVAGCNTSRDCPGGLLCDPALDEHGRCVECLQDGDCDTGQGCRGGTCVALCATDDDCAGLHCEVVSGLCVECLIPDHCALGFVCDAQHACVPGCRTARDCPANQKCAVDLGPNGTCVDCLEDADCPAGKCIQYQCQDSCRSDSDCVIGYCQLSSGRCLECLQDGQCAAGKLCFDGFCARGCRRSEDCVPPLQCDTSFSPGQCVQCLSDVDCSGGTCEAGFCRYPGKQCGESCSAGSSECAQGLFCGVFFGTCLPQCATDADCLGGMCVILYGSLGVCLTCPALPCYPPCAPDEECQAQQCVGRCFPPCDFGTVCDDGSCLPADTGCSPPCEESQFCYGASCQPLETDSCPAGMIYLAERRVCVDRFEASLRSGSLGNADGTGTTAMAVSIAGREPISMVTYYQAKQICLNSGKRLCTAPEWSAACAGTGNLAYPYGQSYVEGYCNSNTQESSARLCGSFVHCISPTGAVDMSGNVWEWTDTQYSSVSDRKVLGGGFGSTPENSTCTTDLNAINGAALPLTEARASLGFRCCLTK
ncbi:MAG: formylglycine-generating enzyme family protein [Myxococcales bacterium]|nr:formylglycine-generating enzyme family protein [Myxococcales bacterium]